MTNNLGVWTAAICTIITFSFLWKTNRLYRLAEHVLLAIASGHIIVLGWQNVKSIAWDPVVQKGQTSLLIPLILGVLLYTRYIKSVAWVSRIPTAVLIGCGSALALRGSIQAQLLQQIASTASPLKSIDSVLVLFGTVVTISYFTYTYKAQGLTTVSRAGRWVMMIGFGAAFGAAVMGRLSLVVGRFQFLFGDWLGLMK